MIQEFKISITAMGGEQYLVRTEYVEKGVQLAEEKVHWPVAEWLSQTQSLMHDPLLGLLQGQSRHTLPSRAGQSGQKSVEAEENTLVRLGQTLHNSLFQGQMHDSWVTAQGVAQNRQDLLRLRIGMKDSRLQQLPWEALHARSLPLATGTDVIFSRYILARQHGSASELKPADNKQVLRILMVISAPEDQERLELKREVYHLQSELHPEQASDDETLLDVQLKILEQPDRAELTQELDRGDYQVLHYAGHSNLGNAGGDLYLVSHQTGLTERLSGEDLAGLLVNNGIKLAVFNSCRGGYSASLEQGWQERNLAEALVNRGLPSVIAMSDRIPDHVAITFTQLLYRNLKKGQSVDLSLNRTRQGLISAYGSHQFYWALPTLYMQPSFEGYLVKPAGVIENADILNTASDPFGSNPFDEPELARISLSPPARRNAQLETVRKVSATTHLDLNDENVNKDMVDNHDADPEEAVVKQLSTPLAPVEVDGELRVPEQVETPLGFYGEPATASNATASNMTKNKAESAMVRTTATSDSSKASRPVAGSTAGSIPAANVPAAATAAQNEAESELVGERLSRSHTLHTKLLTLPALTSLALAGLLAVMTFAWWQQRDRVTQVTPAAPQSAASEQDLVAQAEIAFDRDNLDAAVMTTKQLIDNGDYQSAINALDNASPTQAEDPIVYFFKGRAQWGLAKQGITEYAAGDAMRSWSAGLAAESDWMEFAMALGFAQYAINRSDEALDTWQKAIDLAVAQPNGIIYFSDQPVPEYAVNAYAGLAMAALDQSKIAADPGERAELLERATAAYSKVIERAPGEFTEDTLGNNWLWTTQAISDWERAKAELSRVEIE